MDGRSTASAISRGEYEKAIIVCGTGAGSVIVANKFKGVYAVHASSEYEASRATIINNANVLCLGEWMTPPQHGIEIVKAWLNSKFTEGFDEHFRREDGGPVLTPIAAPIANCYAESWIGHLKRECLNYFFCFSLRQLDHIVQTYAEYYNEFRPHQGLDNEIIEPPPQGTGEIVCRERLGGLLKYYGRAA